MLNSNKNMEITKITESRNISSIKMKTSVFFCIYWSFVWKHFGNNHFTLSLCQMARTGCLPAGMHPEVWLRSVWRKMPWRMNMMTCLTWTLPSGRACLTGRLNSPVSTNANCVFLWQQQKKTTEDFVNFNFS